MRKFVARRVASLLVLLCVAGCVPPRVKPPRFGSLQTDERPFKLEHGVELFQARNGLTVALLRDTRTNLVAVDVRYLVGAAEDPEGRRGMAHLVEHVMFEVRGADGEPTIADQLADATLYYNAFTTLDETHYTSTALASRLDEVLAIEAHRMAARCDELPEALLERERDIVIAEERQRRGKLADSFDKVRAALWGKDHPYGRPDTSAQIADVERAEVCRFVEAHYAPDRAILVVSGNLDVQATAKSIAAKFGPLTHRSSGKRTSIAPPALAGTTSEHTAPVDEATAFVFFPGDRWGAVIEDELLEPILQHAMGEAVRPDWITGYRIGHLGGNTARVLVVQIAVNDPKMLGEAVKRVYAAADKAASDPVPALVFEAIRADVRAGYVGGFDEFAGTGAWLADYLQHTTHRRFMLEELDQLATVTPGQVTDYARRVLDRRTSHVALVRPSGKKAVARNATNEGNEREYDLQPWRTPVDPAEADGPLATDQARVALGLEDYTLDNGLRVILAPDPGSAFVDARLVFPVGSASDEPAQPGRAALTARILDNDLDQSLGYEDMLRVRYALQLGTRVSYEVDESTTVFWSRGVATFADWHVWRLFWLIDAGTFDGKQLRQLQDAVSARHDDDDEATPARLRARLLRQRIFGADHPYAAPPPSPAQLRSLGVEDLERFRDLHYRTRGATLIVAGGFQTAAMKREIAELFGTWAASAPPAQAAVPATRPAAGPAWFGIVDPDAAQVGMTVAFATSSDPFADLAPRLVLERMLQDRLRVVRESLGASYGINVAYSYRQGGGVLDISGDLEADRAGAALAAVQAELAAVRDPAALREDFVRARRRALAGVLADSAGATDLADDLERLAGAALPLSYYDDLVTAVARVTPADVATLAAGDLAEQRMVVVVTGVRADLERAFRDAGVNGPILDGDSE